MPVDIREQLDRAAGQTTAQPDVAAAMRRGVQLRRRRRLAISTATVAAVAALVGGAAVLRPAGTPSDLPPVGDQPSTGSIQQLDVFERPRDSDDRIASLIPHETLDDDPRVRRRAPRLDSPGQQVGSEGLADSGSSPLEGDWRASRLAWQQGDVSVYLAPVIGEPVDPDLEPLDGEWLYVVLARPGPEVRVSAPVPASGTATWAGSVNLRGTWTAILVVGDGLDHARGPTGSVAVQDNVVLVEDVERGDRITLSGPAGDFTLSIPREGAEGP